MNNYILLFLNFDEYAPIILKTCNFLLEKIYPEKEVYLFHVLEEALTSPVYLLPYLKFEIKKIEQELKDLWKKAGLPTEKIREVVAFGERWSNLENLLQRINPAFAILGYKPHLLKVTMAETLIERLELSFLALKRYPLEKIEKILCLFDFSQDAKKALKLSLHWASQTKAQVTILNFYLGNHFKNSEETVLHSLKERLYHNVLNQLSEEEKGLVKEILFLQISKTEEVLNLLSKSNFDIVFLGRKGHSLSKGMGSFSKFILKSFDGPVFIAVMEG